MSDIRHVLFPTLFLNWTGDYGTGDYCYENESS